MNLELINTGSELLLGTTLNSHLVYLAQQLLPLGLRIARQITVPDSIAISGALIEALPRCDIILITGGLGPTTDDLTREIVAELLKLPLHPNSEIRRKIETRLARSGVQLQENMLSQAMVPEGAEILHNEYGTAPGLYIPASTAPKTPHIFLFPGPPQELKPMFEGQAHAILKKIATGEKIVEQRIFSIIGMGETMIEQKIGLELLRDGRIEVGYCPRLNDVDFRLIADPDILEEVTPRIHQALGNHIASTKGETLEQVVVEQLRNKKESLAVAESCTGGLLAHRITNIPGASEVFLEGLVTYSNHAKAAHLGIAPSLIEQFGAVSEEVAREMAEKLLPISGAQHTLSLTGVAGPGGGTPDKPVGTVFIGIASLGLPTEVHKRFFLTQRESFKQLATQSALDMLRRRLL